MIVSIRSIQCRRVLTEAPVVKFHRMLVRLIAIGIRLRLGLTILMYAFAQYRTCHPHAAAGGRRQVQRY
eukprot:15470905-Alexandrium_andersonii.AAC.1